MILRSISGHLEIFLASHITPQMVLGGGGWVGSPLPQIIAFIKMSAVATLGIEFLLNYPNVSPVILFSALLFSRG